jgi:hypothetical protein
MVTVNRDVPMWLGLVSPWLRNAMGILDSFRLFPAPADDLVLNPDASNRT